MANKYSRYQLQPYVSQYVDPQTTKINAMLRQRWETNKAQHDQLQQLANSTQVGKFDQKWKDAAIDDIRSKFSDTIKTNAYENSGAVVSDAVNSFIANEPLKAAAQSYQWWEKGEEVKFELQAQGKNVLFDKVTLKNEDGSIKRDETGQPIWVDPFDLHSSYSVNEETGETSVNIYKPGAQGQLPWQAEMEKLVQGMKDMDPIMLQRYNLTNTELDGYLMYGTETSPETLKKMAALLMDNYMSSDSGIQQNRYLLEQAINPVTGEHYDASEAYDKILKQLEATALKNKSINLNYREDKAYWEMLKGLADKGDDNAKSIIQPPTIRQGIMSGFDPYTALDFMSNKKNRKDGKLQLKYFNDNLNYEFKTGSLKGETLSSIFNKYDNVEDMQANMEEELGKYLRQYNLALGDQTTQELVTDTWIKANSDLYLANLIYQNKEAYFATENGERVFKNDKEFLESISKSMEEIKNKYRPMRVVSNAYSNYMTESFSNGTYDNSTWSFRNPNTGEMSNSKNQFVSYAANYYKQKGNRGGSGKNETKTSKAIFNALSDSENLKLSGFMPGGSTPGSYVVTLNVPGGTGTVNEGLGTAAFQVQFEIASVDDIQEIFEDTHQIVDNLANGNFDWEGEINLGSTFDENNLVTSTSIANVDYFFDPKSKQWETRAVVSIYDKKDLDQSGMPKRDSDGTISVTPRESNTYLGNWLIDELFQANLDALMQVDHFEAFLTGEASKGVIEPKVFE